MNITEFTDYKEYLNGRLDDSGRGSRAKLSNHIACQTAYTTQVLRGSAHFSLEQAELINEFLSHTEDEGYLFLLLVQWARAGTIKLKNRFEKQIKKASLPLSTLKGRLNAQEELTENEQPRYYSTWINAAIHAIVSIPNFQNTDKISSALGINAHQVNQALDFLIRSGILKRDKNGAILTGKKQIHLGSDSPLISKHHMNWRLQAMRAIESNPLLGLHYSSTISISNKDRNFIKDKIIEALKEIKQITKESKEEDLCCLSIDFYSLIGQNEN